VLFLDIDGVLNRTGFQPAELAGLRSWIEPELASRLCEVVRATNTEIVLASDWRLNRDLQELQDELHAAGIDVALIGATPELQGQPRWREVEAWMVEHHLAHEAVAIVDDKHDMGPLSARFVRVSPLNGLDDHAAQALRALFEPTSS
jgi:hypothetical protein